jgi:hypothetical protein
VGDQGPPVGGNRYQKDATLFVLTLLGEETGESKGKRPLFLANFQLAQVDTNSMNLS